MSLLLADDYGVDTVQIVGGVVVDFDAAFLFRLFHDAHAGSKDAFHLLDGRFDVGVQIDLVHMLGLAVLHHLLGSALGLADGPPLGDGLLGDFTL